MKHVLLLSGSFVGLFGSQSAWANCIPGVNCPGFRIESPRQEYRPPQPEYRPPQPMYRPPPPQQVQPQPQPQPQPQRQVPGYRPPQTEYRPPQGQRQEPAHRGESEQRPGREIGHLEPRQEREEPRRKMGPGEIWRPGERDGSGRPSYDHDYGGRHAHPFEGHLRYGEDGISYYWTAVAWNGSGAYSIQTGVSLIEAQNKALNNCNIFAAAGGTEACIVIPSYVPGNVPFCYALARDGGYKSFSRDPDMSIAQSQAVNSCNVNDPNSGCQIAFTSCNDSWLQ